MRGVVHRPGARSKGQKSASVRPWVRRVDMRGVAFASGPALIVGLGAGATAAGRVETTVAGRRVTVVVRTAGGAGAGATGGALADSAAGSTSGVVAIIGPASRSGSPAGSASFGAIAGSGLIDVLSTVSRVGATGSLWPALLRSAKPTAISAHAAASSMPYLRSTLRVMTLFLTAVTSRDSLDSGVRGQGVVAGGCDPVYGSELAYPNEPAHCSSASASSATER